MRFMFINFLLALFTTLLISRSEAVLLEGDPCTIRYQPGVCRPQHQCQQIWGGNIQLPPRNEEIPRCDQLVQNMVCCPTILTPSFFSPRNTERVVGSAANEYKVIDEIFNTPTTDKYEFIAAIGMKNNETGETRLFCGGTIISDRFILTTAHCVARRTEQPNIVILGSLFVNNPDKEINFEIEKIHIHPDFSLQNVYNEIALIELKDHSYSSNILPICLDTETSLPPGQFAAYVATWKKRVEVSVLPLETCRKEYEPMLPLRRLFDGIRDTLLCARERDGYICNGDSGYPLIFQNSNVLHVAGISGFGFSCGSEIPVLYTRVVSYLKFIEDIVWPAEKSESNENKFIIK